MRHSLFVRILTLLVFITMISGFLLYRTGKLGDWFSNSQTAIQESPNGSVLRSNNIDTTIVPKHDSITSLRLASSKVLILTDDRLKKLSIALMDSAKRRNIRLQQQQLKERKLMYSSKSLQVFSSIDSMELKLDSIIHQIKKKGY